MAWTGAQSLLQECSEDESDDVLPGLWLRWSQCGGPQKPSACSSPGALAGEPIPEGTLPMEHVHGDGMLL